MKTEQLTLITSITAAADIAKNLFIGFDGALCSAGAKALGVVNDDSLADEQVPVGTVGIALILSGDAVSSGDAVESDAAGKAVTFSAGEINGYALDDASGADELIRVLLK
ncbi:MAG: DUF2190 family protein [Ignavibacteriaceae bacterium]|nr:DUF2190 family protein [Ignavibacteriaceae bacterium]